MIFASCFAYAFGKMTRPHTVAALEDEMKLGESSVVPGFRTLARLSKLDDVERHLDCSTCITRARSRAHGNFLRSAAEQWITIDDDSEASTSALKNLRLLATEDPRTVLIAAQRLADDRGWNVFPSDGSSVDDKKPGVVFPVIGGGMSLVIFPKRAALEVAGAYPELRWKHVETETINPGVFLEMVENQVWYGEDQSFIRRALRARACRFAAVRLHGVSHAGLPSVE